MNGSIIKYIKRNKKTFVFSGACIFLSLFFILLARNIDGIAQWYAVNIFPVFPNTLGKIFSLFPFSVFEFCIYNALLILIYLLIKITWLAIKRSPLLKTYLSKYFRRGICIISGMLLIFTLTASINYSREAIDVSTDLSVHESTEDELTQLCLLLINDISELVADIPADNEGLLVIDREDISSEVVNAMKKLGNRFPSLSGYYPDPKPVLLSGTMSYLGITGIYSPFTLEANFNNDVADYIIPYTIGHELAHFKGFMKEEEAGFIAYIACRDSESPVLRYSAALNALIYSLNALNKNVSWDDYRAVYDRIPETVRSEYNYSHYYWLRHTSGITSVAKKANDQYLIANAQTDGTKSYGKMVDLLLAEYADKIRDADGELL